MNMMISEYFGQYFVRLPLKKSADIIHANSLQIPWEDVINSDKLTYILGNPPFIGSNIMTKIQRAEVVKEFHDVKGAGVLDYVTAWYLKASKYIQNTKIKVAFVSTNSIVQGEQVGILWKELFSNYGIKIHFAHQTFNWSNEAKSNAAVHVVIIGFAQFDSTNKRIFEYENIKSNAHEKSAKNINAYLVEGDDIVIEKRRKPLCNVLNIIKGNYYAKSEGLIIEEKDLDYLVKNEPNAKKWIKLLIGADEFINNRKRYCLWLVDCPPDELRKMPLVMERVNRVREDRLKSTDKGMQNLAPIRFRETNNPDKCIVIPVVSSEKRPYIPIGFIDKNTISTNGNLIIPNGDLFLFGQLTSLMHMAWVKYTCGRLKSDYRYSKDLVYNNYPFPKNVSEKQKKAVEEKAQNVLDIRASFSDCSLADLYDPLSMPPNLKKAHQELDKAVDNCYGSKSFKNDKERIEFLFGLYEEYLNTQK